MPYPPPAPPPTVGFFQGIGKLIAPTLPDVTGHATEFLETDGVIPQWEPVTGVLPVQAGHAGEFLTTDGAVASWAPSTGGVVTIGALTTPTANAATIVGTVLSLAPANASNPGVMTTTAQTISGQKLFTGSAATDIFDIRSYGAVPNDSTFDNAPAIYAAIAAWTQQAGGGFEGGQTGGVYVPEGVWYVSRPIIPPANCTFRGAGHMMTAISAGIGTPANPSLVQAFGGQLFYLSYTPVPSSIVFPAYTASLATGPGQAMLIQPTDPTHPSNN